MVLKESTELAENGEAKLQFLLLKYNLNELVELTKNSTKLGALNYTIYDLIKELLVNLNSNFAILDKIEEIAFNGGVENG